MKKSTLIQALRNREIFDSLSADERSLVAASSPIGQVDLSDDLLASVSGGLEGKAAAIETTTTTKGSCSCTASGRGDGMGSVQDCACGCTPAEPAPAN